MSQLSSSNRVALGLMLLKTDQIQAEPLLTELRAGVRHWKDLSERELQTLERGPLIDFLLEKSFSLRFDNPTRMVDLARAACVVADNLRVRRYGKEVVADLRARAWAEYANACRVNEDFDAAGAALSRAVEFAGQGTRSPALIARCSEVTASYFVDQRRFNDAIPLLEVACELYRDQREQAGLENCLLKLARAFGQANEPERAVLAYLRVYRQMGLNSTNKLSTVHGLCLYLVECELPEVADTLLRYHLQLYRRKGKLNSYRRFWLEGKIAFGLHDYGKAEGKLNTARLAFRHANQTFDAALVSLDLALMYVKQGRRREVIWLVDDMLLTFTALGIAREALASLVLLKKSCEKQRTVEALCGQIDGLAKLLPELALNYRKRPAVV